MKIIGTQIRHKVFGKGTVKECKDGYIIVTFDVGDKRFVFPDAFFHYLTTDDDDINAYLNYLKEQQDKVLKEREDKKNQAALAQKSKELQQKSGTKVKEKTKSPKKANVAFKCNYCDGGRTEKQVGFNGVCSDPIIYNNIEIENRTWCNMKDCPCFQYFNQEISREELDAECDDGGFVCYESQMLRDWKAFAGVYHHGERKNQPIKLYRVQKNSLCVLTTRKPGMEEKDRFIFAVFMVDNAYEGDEKEEGFVSANSKYKIKLAPKEAERMLFWNYHANDNRADKPAWNTGLYRYFNDDMAAQILRNIVKLKENTEDYELAKEFLEYYCQVHRINVDTIGEPHGALKRSCVSKGLVLGTP